jgi:hypothetical protein
MKNRASAERSRQRKQAYVEELEMKMAAVISEKMILQVPCRSDRTCHWVCLRARPSAARSRCNRQLSRTEHNMHEPRQEPTRLPLACPRAGHMREG